MNTQQTIEIQDILDKMERHKPREMYVLACLLEHQGSKKIANILDVKSRTVEKHIENLFSLYQTSALFLFE